MSQWTLKARWVFPVEGPPLAGGLVTIDADRIVAIEPHGCRSPDLDLGNAAILPGLVNAHTHLDLTGLRGRVQVGENFTTWLRAVIRHRRELSPNQLEADIRAALVESLAQGTTLLGDIAAGGTSWPVLAAAPLRGVVFYELLGLPRFRARQAWADACTWLAGHPGTTSCRPGLSPHAPYSVHRALYRLAVRLARKRRLPLSSHLAETPAELELLAGQRGPLREFLMELGVWDPSGLVRSVDQVLQLHHLSAVALFAHGNYLEPAAAIPPSCAIVYCPRTHAAFGHKPHPFRHFLARGVRVALGTDSLASNPDLDVLAEARFVHQRYPDVSGAALLRMATLSGAEALGWQDLTGSLTPGKSADLVVLPLPRVDARDPYQLVFESSLPVRAVLCRGHWIHGDLAGSPANPAGTP